MSAAFIQLLVPSLLLILLYVPAVQSPPRFPSRILSIYSSSACTQPFLGLVSITKNNFSIHAGWTSVSLHSYQLPIVSLLSVSFWLHIASCRYTPFIPYACGGPSGLWQKPFSICKPFALLPLLRLQQTKYILWHPQVSKPIRNIKRPVLSSFYTQQAHTRPSCRSTNRLNTSLESQDWLPQIRISSPRCKLRSKTMRMWSQRVMHK